MKMMLLVGTGLVGGALMFQMPSTPPMKMGLWESSTAMKMSGMDLPPGMAMPNTTMKVRACMTPENYAKNLGASQRQKDCTRTNETWANNHYSFDMACKSGNATGHFDMAFESKESGHAVMHMNMNPGSGHTMQMDMVIDSHFISSDCGNVSPDKPEIIR